MQARTRAKANPSIFIDESNQPPLRGGLFLRFLNEVDAASGIRCDWRRDPDGDDGDVADVA